MYDLEDEGSNLTSMEAPLLDSQDSANKIKRGT